uniref:Uncharacterized protein n=1 Tax=Ciona savignyi TaxID=51511 RepID=H2YAW0_CIOSA
KLTSLADEIVAKTESHNTLQRNLQQIEEKHKNDISLLQFELENLQDDLGSLTDINTALEADVQKREADLLRSRATHQEEQDRWKRDLEERSQQNNELRRKLDVAIQDQENRGVSDAEILRLETQLKERSEEFNKLSATQDEIVQLYNSSRERCSAFKEEVNALHVRLGSADNKVSALQVELTNVQTVNDGLNDELSRMNEKNQSLNDCIDATTLSSTMLSEKIERLEVENANLHKEAAILAGHTNHRQKIHYLSKVKNDLVAVTNERNLLEAQCAKQVEDLRKYGHIFNTSTSQVRRSKSPIPDGINSSVP